MRVHKMRSTAIVLGALVALIAAAVIFFWLRPISVAVVEPVESADVDVYGLGTVEARVLSEIGFQVAGTLVELNADHGDHVAAGAVIASLESAAQAARLAKAEAGVALAEAALDQAKARVGRARAILAEKRQINQRRQELVARGTVSVEVAQETHTAAEVAAADVVLAESEVDLAAAALEDARASANVERALLSYYTLTAPYDGVVVKRHAEPGAAFNPAQTLFTFVDPATVWVRAFIDEARAGGLEVGQAAQIRLRSLPQRTFTGHVARIDIESDRVSEERRVHVACDSCPAAFHLGEQAEVVINKGRLPHAILVAESAIDGYDGRSGRIWTIENGRLAQRQVALGERTLDGRIAILDELPPDVQVLSELRPGLRVGRAARIAASSEGGLPAASAGGGAS